MSKPKEILIKTNNRIDNLRLTSSSLAYNKAAVKYFGKFAQLNNLESVA